MWRTGGSGLTWLIILVKLWGQGLETDGVMEKEQGLMQGGELQVEMNTAHAEEE